MRVPFSAGDLPTRARSSDPRRGGREEGCQVRFVVDDRITPCAAAGHSLDPPLTAQYAVVASHSLQQDSTAGYYLI